MNLENKVKLFDAQTEKRSMGDGMWFMRKEVCILCSLFSLRREGARFMMCP